MGERLLEIDAVLRTTSESRAARRGRKTWGCSVVKAPFREVPALPWGWQRESLKMVPASVPPESSPTGP